MSTSVYIWYLVIFDVIVVFNGSLSLLHVPESNECYLSGSHKTSVNHPDVPDIEMSSGDPEARTGSLI